MISTCKIAVRIVKNKQKLLIFQFVLDVIQLLICSLFDGFLLACLEFMHEINTGFQLIYFLRHGLKVKKKSKYAFLKINI